MRPRSTLPQRAIALPLVLCLLCAPLSAQDTGAGNSAGSPSAGGQASNPGLTAAGLQVGSDWVRSLVGAASLVDIGLSALGTLYAVKIAAALPVVGWAAAPIIIAGSIALAGFGAYALWKVLSQGNVRVVSVPTGPGAQAGIQPGDVISHVNGQRIWSPGGLDQALWTANGSPATVRVWRNGTSTDLSLNLSSAGATQAIDGINP